MLYFSEELCYRRSVLFKWRNAWIWWEWILDMSVSSLSSLWKYWKREVYDTVSYCQIYQVPGWITLFCPLFVKYIKWRTVNLEFVFWILLYSSQTQTIWNFSELAWDNLHTNKQDVFVFVYKHVIYTFVCIYLVCHALGWYQVLCLLKLLLCIKSQLDN